MKAAWLGVLLLGCAAHVPPPHTGPEVLFCTAPSDQPAEFVCPNYVDSKTGVVTRKLCPRGYIHQPSYGLTCRRKDNPLPKVQPVWPSTSEF